MKKVILVILLVVASAFAGSQTATESRTHYVVADMTRVPQFYVTSVESRNESRDADSYLIQNVATGQRLRIDTETDYMKHEATGQYSLDNKRSVTVRLQIPFVSATTRQGAIEEGRTHRELWSAEVPITVESRGYSEKTTEKSWKKGADSEDAHRRVKNALDPDVSAAFKSVVPALSFPELNAACATIELVTDGAKCTLSTGLLIATIAPDCAFDVSFGMPCGPDRVVKAKAVRLKGRGGRY